MRRAAPTLPVTPAMLRHFVVITLAATAGLAMFAHGENTGAMIEAQKASRARSSGAWGTTPKQADQAKAPTSVNGMNVAPGTKLQSGGGSSDDYEAEKTIQSGEGNIRYLSPEYSSLEPGSLAQADAGPGQTPAAPAQIQRDSKGVPLPPGSTLRGQPPSANRQPPRRATVEEIQRMMEASRLRGAGNRPGGGESPTSDY